MNKYLIMVIGTCFVFVFDQLTKMRIAYHFTLRESAQIIPGFLDFSYVHNSGAAFGIFSQYNKTFFLAISGIAVVFIIYFFLRIERHQTMLAFALSLIMGGAMGNLIDRFRMGYVIDFIDIHVGSLVWPTFNVADIAICVGVAIMVMELFLPHREPIAQDRMSGSMEENKPSAS